MARRPRAPGKSRGSTKYCDSVTVKGNPEMKPFCCFRQTTDLDLKLGGGDKGVARVGSVLVMLMTRHGWPSLHAQHRRFVIIVQS
jgi:hypothetical protein